MIITVFIQFIQFIQFIYILTRVYKYIYTYKYIYKIIYIYIYISGEKIEKIEEIAQPCGKSIFNFFLQLKIFK